MNAYEQLQSMKKELIDLAAHEDTIKMINALIKKAEPEQFSQTQINLQIMVKHMFKQKEVLDNYNIYDDLQALLSQHEAQQEREVHPAWDDPDHHPKPKSFYKQQKEKTKK